MESEKEVVKEVGKGTYDDDKEDHNNESKMKRNEVRYQQCWSEWLFRAQLNSSLSQ